GKSYRFRDGEEVCIIATGNIMSVAFETADQLEAAGVSTRIEGFHTVKPLDTETLLEVCDRYKVVVVMEEHGSIGGFYGAVAEWYAAQSPQPKARLIGCGMEDRFYHRIGSQSQIRKEGGLTADAISANVLKALEGTHVTCA